MKSRLAVLFLAAAVAVAVAAFALPWLAHPDAPVSPPETARYLRGEARHWSSIPPLRLQISEVRAAPAQPQGLGSATLTWRGPFGIAYGRTTIEDDLSVTRWQHRRLAAAWGAFAAVEVVLLGAAALLVWRAP